MIDRRAYQRSWRNSNLEYVHARDRGRALAKRLSLLDHYSAGTFSCRCCGEGFIEFLALDHVSNDGHTHRANGIQPKLGQDLQVLCHNCNCGRATNGGECPHTHTVDKLSSESVHARFQFRRRLQVLRIYSDGIPKCACCGETTAALLTIDHADGEGNRHRKSVGPNICWWLKRHGYPKGFRVLCYNCNMCIGDNGYCAHDRHLDAAASLNFARSVVATSQARLPQIKRLFGVTNGSCKLNASIVARIRELATTCSQRQLARTFHVSKTQVARIIHGTHWQAASVAAVQ